LSLRHDPADCALQADASSRNAAAVCDEYESTNSKWFVDLMRRFSG
jgi:hypothetical protein